MKTDRSSEDLNCSIPERILGMSVFEEEGNSVLDLARSAADSPNRIGWRPVADDDNNRGNVDIVSNEMQAFAETISNSNDGYLLGAYDGTQSSREEILDSFDDRPTIDLQLTGSSGGRGSSEGYSVVIADSAVGVEQSEFEDAFLKNPSEGAVDKREFEFMGGEFGQGSLASIGVSEKGCKFVASAHKSNPCVWNWTVTRYNESVKRYEYMTIGGQIPTTECVFSAGDIGTYTHGTITKVFNIDSKRTPNNATNGTFLRNLAYNYPNSDFPLYIYDNRAKTKSARSVLWHGLLPEIRESDSFLPEKTKEITVDGIGRVTISAFIGKDEENIPSRFLSSTDKQRGFFTVNGMTHHAMSSARVKSQFDLENINEESLFFIDCSEITTEFTNVFKSDRTQLNGRAKATTLFESVCEAVQSWDTVQSIDSDRQSFDPKSFKESSEDTRPVISGLEMVSDSTAIQPTIKANANEKTTVEFSVQGPTEYVKNTPLDVTAVNVDGDYVLEQNGDTISLTVTPSFTSGPEFTVVLTVTDTKEEATFKESFTLAHADNNPISVSEKIDSVIREHTKNPNNSVYSLMDAKEEFVSWVQSHYPYKNGNQVWRSVSGTYLEEATAKLAQQSTCDAVTVSKESETPTHILEQLEIGELDVSPDTDIVIHNNDKPLGVISCKTTLRERVGQTAFWKLASERFNMDIPYYLVTTDQDGELTDGRKWVTVIDEFLDKAFVADTARTEYSESIRPLDELATEVDKIQR